MQVPLENRHVDLKIVDNSGRANMICDRNHHVGALEKRGLDIHNHQHFIFDYEDGFSDWASNARNRLLTASQQTRVRLVLDDR